MDSATPADGVEAALLEEVEFATGLPVEGPKRLGCCHDGPC